MKTIVLTGGTDGIGKALAQTFLARGDRVILVGGNPAKARSVLTDVDSTRAIFVPADLSLVSETRRVIAQVTHRFPVVDVLILCARFFRSSRAVTVEGFESNFALMYLSRFLLSHGLAQSLAMAVRPMVINVAGPGADIGLIRWDDLQLVNDYSGVEALVHAGKLNDLLGVSFSARHASSRIRYVLFHPGTTATSFAGEYDPATAAQIEAMRAVAKSPEEAAAPIVDCIDLPPSEPLSAFFERTPLDLAGPAFASDAANRLHDTTVALLTACKQRAGDISNGTSM